MKVHITVRRGSGKDAIVVDEKDISRYVSRDGIDLDVTQPGLPKLHLTLIPDEVIVDGDVLLDVERASITEAAEADEAGGA